METSTLSVAPHSAPSSQVLLLLRQLKEFYADFSLETLAGLDTLYTQDVDFRDPVHTLRGCLALKAYFRRMAGNLKHYKIRYLDEQIGAHSAWLLWEMDFAHEHLRGGSTLTVRGMTQLRYTCKVYSHEDCYDLGALLYEQVPVLGPLNRMLKQRLAG